MKLYSLHLLKVDCGLYVKNGTMSGAIALEPGVKPPRVELVTCNRMFEPVCSLDSHTYSNECSFCHSLALRYLISKFMDKHIHAITEIYLKMIV